MNTARDRKNNLNSLQLLRGIAAILVVFFHGLASTDFFQVVKYGEMGVDLFFVLSGFIIFYIHYSDIGVKSKFQHFLIKRFLRIFPLYWIVMSFYMILIIPFGHSFSFEYILKSVLLLPQQAIPIVGVAWTLEYEILFYVLFSLFMFNSKIFYPALLIWGITILLFLNSPSIRTNSLIMNKVLNPINLEFIFGCGIALLVLKNKFDFKWVPKASILVGILGICFSLVINYLGFRHIHNAISLGISFAILIFGLVKLEFTQNLSVPKICVYLGDASYSIYLTHLITLMVLSKVIEKIGLFFYSMSLDMFYITSCILAVLVGCFFYSFIEKPLIKYFKENIINIKKSSLNYA